jgi:RHS repeat-associated protein
VTNRQSQAVLAGFELYYGNEAAACGASTVTTNNGNVLKQKILPLGVVQNFGYDSWDRLNHVDEKVGSVEQWRQDYVYDRWGNRAVNSTTSTAPVTNVTPQVADGSAAAMSGRYPGRNRSVMSGATVECGSGNSQYDCAGNMILYGADTASAQKLVYDGENRLVEVKDSSNTTVAKYFYDGDGRRVRRSSGGRETVYGYAADGQLLAEWEVAAQPATSMTCTTCYFGVDHLGSTRIVAASDGTVEKRIDYAPFGEEAPAGWSGRTEAMKYELGVAARWNPQRVRFTGKERDGETGLDYFLARYYSGAQGRFTSPDWAAEPEAVPYAKLEDPQTLNLYAYVRNNPMIIVDVDGHGDIFDRLIRFGTGIASVGFGAVKVNAGAALLAVSPGAGPLAPGPALVGFYGVANGTGQVVSGTADVVYAISNNEQANTVAQWATATTTVAGLTTLAAGGSVDLAAGFGSVENLIPSGPQGAQKATSTISGFVAAANSLLQTGTPPSAPLLAPIPAPPAPQLLRLQQRQQQQQRQVEASTCQQGSSAPPCIR